VKRFLHQSRLAIWILLLAVAWLAIHAARAFLLTALFTLAYATATGRHEIAFGWEIALLAFFVSVGIAWVAARRRARAKEQQLGSVFD